MAKLPSFNITGLNLKLNPFSHRQGELIRALNLTNDFQGGKTKRTGYVTFLGTPDNDQVDTIFQWTKNDGTSSWLYRASGSILYYWDAGVGTETSWSVCGNGTIGNGAGVGYAVLEDTLILGDGVNNTRHTTNGTSFTNTTNAPIARYFAEFEQRVWAGGTASDVFYSTTGDATDWTTDSSSINIPGAGKINQVFKQNNRLITTKNSGLVFKYDGNSLYDLATDLGPSSPNSVGSKEDIRFWQNRDGYFAFSGLKPELISNAVERQIYNKDETGIPGGNFDTNAGIVHRYTYYCSAGTITDDFNSETIDDAIHTYDLQNNEWLNWKLNDFPTAWGNYKDNGGTQHLLFGDAGGQAYRMSGTAYDDNGSAIPSVIEGVLHYGSPENPKEFKQIWAFFNPGARAKVQVAISDTFTRQEKKWVDLEDAVNGVARARFPEGSRGRMLFWKIYENSKSPPYRFFGFVTDVTIIEE